MNKIVAKAISIALHPVVMPCLMMLILFNSGTMLSFYPLDLQVRIFLLIFINTFVLPLLLLPLFLRRKLITSIQMFNHSERIIPFLFTLIFYGASVFILMGIKGLVIVKVFMVAASIALFITMLFSFVWKISAHMVGIGGVTGFLLVLALRGGADVQLFLLLAVLLSGAVGSSRLTLQEHSPLQIYAGYAVGLITMLTVFYIA